MERRVGSGCLGSFTPSPMMDSSCEVDVGEIVELSSMKTGPSRAEE